MDRLEQNLKKLAKTEKFVNALGQLAKELEINQDLGSIFQSSSSWSEEQAKSSEESFRDPKFLWSWIKNFFVKFMELKKSHLNIERSLQSAQTDLKEERVLADHLQEKI